MSTPTYEHRLRPGQPHIVEVRRVARRQHRPPGAPWARDQSPWRCYMQCDTPQQAAHVLMLLRHGEPESAVME